MSFIEKYIFSLLLAPVSLSFESAINECASSVNRTSGISPSYPFFLNNLLPIS